LAPSRTSGDWLLTTPGSPRSEPRVHAKTRRRILRKSFTNSPFPTLLRRMETRIERRRLNAPSIRPLRLAINEWRFPKTPIASEQGTAYGGSTVQRFKSSIDFKPARSSRSNPPALKVYRRVQSALQQSNNLLKSFKTFNRCAHIRR
jgi:hypothetical protein